MVLGARGAVPPALACLRRPLRDALILVGLGQALVYFVIRGIHPWEFAGPDARVYWGCWSASAACTGRTTLGRCW